MRSKRTKEGKTQNKEEVKKHFKSVELLSGSEKIVFLTPRFFSHKHLSNSTGLWISLAHKKDAYLAGNRGFPPLQFLVPMSCEETKVRKRSTVSNEVS